VTKKRSGRRAHVLPGDGQGEFFYLDKDGKRQDAELHAELLGDDTCPWDLHDEDLDRIAVMTDKELDRFLEQRQAAGAQEGTEAGLHAGPVGCDATASSDRRAAVNLAWVARKRETSGRQAKAAGRYPRTVTADDITRWRAVPSTLDLPVVGDWLPKGYGFSDKHWHVELSMDQPGQRTPEDLELICTSIADFVEAITPGLAYGIRIQVRPAWCAVQEFIPPVAQTRGSQ
jgi:hypothetical protein